MLPRESDCNVRRDGSGETFHSRTEGSKRPATAVGSLCPAGTVLNRVTHNGTGRSLERNSRALVIT
jgi:hypothetical protein